MCSNPLRSPAGLNELDALEVGQPNGETGHHACRTVSDCRLPSRTHVVIIPSFNSGKLLKQTVSTALLHWAPVWVVIDGSTDESAGSIDALASTAPQLRLFRCPINQGKGAAVRVGLEAAEASGFTHALVMDADGQHPAASIPAFMAISSAAPRALVMGLPAFGPDAPWLRVVSRRLCNAIATVLAMRRVGDTLFGFRVYPVGSLLSAMRASRGMRRFDFDAEAVVRLAWDGIPFIHALTPVRYLDRKQDGISHFKYGRDNLLLAGMVARLTVAGVARLWRRRGA